jgi:hypothetical protein
MEAGRFCPGSPLAERAWQHQDVTHHTTRYRCCMSPRFYPMPELNHRYWEAAIAG